MWAGVVDGAVARGLALCAGWRGRGVRARHTASRGLTHVYASVQIVVRAARPRLRPCVVASPGARARLSLLRLLLRVPLRVPFPLPLRRRSRQQRENHHKKRLVRRAVLEHVSERVRTCGRWSASQEGCGKGVGGMGKETDRSGCPSQWLMTGIVMPGTMPYAGSLTANSNQSADGAPSPTTVPYR